MDVGLEYLKESDNRNMLKNASFHVRSNLFENGYINFESTNFPNWYLVQQGEFGIGVLCVHTLEEALPASWRLEI